jgi:hypothetical protein
MYVCFNHKLNIGDEYYLISCEWMRRLDEYIRQKYDEKQFGVSRTLKLFFQDENFDYDKIKGGFPGPINNFKIADFVDSWYDDLDIHANQYIVENLTEKNDYFLISKEMYTVFKKHFTSILDIPRYVIKTDNDEKIIEVNLRKVNIIL